LNAYGVNDVHVLTHREVTAVASPIHSARMVHFERDADDSSRCHALPEGGQVPLAAYLAGFDIVVNCVLQHTDAPLMFVTADDVAAFASGTLIVDVSCDAGMGFSWARPTSFADPMFAVGSTIHYYAVDHSPSLLWNSATWEISEALLPFLKTVLGGPGAWDGDETIRRAIEIRDGIIQNPDILSFQHREPKYPHPRLG
jgi:alanine dehydrogenase